MTENPISAVSNDVTAPAGFWDEERTAQVVVRNNTSMPIVGVGVTHKYSNDYMDSGTWGIIMPGECGKAMTVNYRTGPFTTGRDWWTVHWQDSERFCYSNPVNFRELTDLFDGIAPEVLGKLARIGVEVGVAYRDRDDHHLSYEEIDQIGQAAETLTKLIVKQFINSESTKGFKQHILRSEDENRTTEITIYDRPEDSIVFRSKSGISVTNTAWKEQTI